MDVTGSELVSVVLGELLARKANPVKGQRAHWCFAARALYPEPSPQWETPRAASPWKGGGGGSSEPMFKTVSNRSFTGGPTVPPGRLVKFPLL